MDTAAARFGRLRELFDAALDLPLSQQDAFARENSSDDPELAAQLGELLRQHRHVAGVHTADLQRSLFDVLPAATRVGTRLGDYTITGELGSGGMGRVFRGERQHPDFTQQVAIKLLRQELLNPEVRKRFAVERKLLAGLNHPGICRLIDVGSDVDDTPFVVMELIEGMPLFDYCEQTRLGLVERLKLFRSVLAAVSHAHRNLIVHRDLKSSNILVDAHGQAKLLDFGIAKILDAGAERTATADRYLSLCNAAPEQLLGGHLTVACDVYALGTVLYELLCGLPPFDLELHHSGQLQQQILKVPPPAMSRRLADAADEIARRRGLSSTAALRRKLAGELESIVQQCLRKAPGERYSSVEQLDEDLGRVLGNRPIRAAAGQRWYVLRKFLARHRLPAVLTGLLLLATVAGVASVAARNRIVVKERDRARQALQILRDAFISADPARVAGEDVRVREVLEAAVPALESSFQSQPELYATLASSIAEVQLKIGLSTDAAALFERAADAAGRSDLPPTEHAQLLVVRARALHAAGDFDLARASLDQAAALVPTVSPEWEIVKATSLGQQGDYTGAIRLLRHALEQMETRSAQDEWANNARLRLADAQQNAGDGDAALATLDAALDWQRAQLSSQHPRIALTRLHRVIQLQAMGQGEAALADAQQVHADLATIYGAKSPFAAKAAMVLANSLSSQERYTEAAIAYAEVVEIFVQHLGERHPNTIRARYNLAAMLATDPKRHAEALALFHTTLATGEARLGSESNAVTVFRYAYAEALLDGGEAQQALEVLTSAAGIRGLKFASADNRSSTLELLGKAHLVACGKSLVASGNGCYQARTLLDTGPKP